MRKITLFGIILINFIMVLLLDKVWLFAQEKKNSPGEMVGTTWFDYQSNASRGRQIASNEFLGIPIVWMNATSAPPYQRYVYYNYRFSDGNWLAPGTGVPISQAEWSGGFPQVAFLSDNRAAVAYHYAVADPPYFSVLAIETAPGSGVFNTYDIPDSIQGARRRGDWPKMAVDSSDYMHILVNEYIPWVDLRGFGYMRAHLDGNDSLLVEFPGFLPIKIGPNVLLPPSSNVAVAMVDSEMHHSPIVTCSPVSNKVAIIYIKPRPGVYYPYRWDADVLFIESTNGGQDWIDAGAFPEPVNASNYADPDTERAGREVSACYDYNDVLHILWPAHWFKPELLSNASNLDHWSQEAPERHLVAYAPWRQGSAPTYHCFNVCWANIGVNPSNNYLYAVWNQFNPGDLAQNSYTNAEIYGAASSNGGLNWDYPRNLTNTPTPGCAPGECESDDWSNLAEIANDTLHIFYVNDKDAGAAIEAQGTWTENPVMYLRIPAWEPDVRMEMVVFPESLHIRRPDASQIRDTSFHITNSGNTYLTYEITPDSSWLWIDPYANILLPAETTVINLHIDSVDLGDTAFAQIRIECNDPENPLRIIPVFVYTILIRGDANWDEKIDIADVVYLINYLFIGGPPPLSLVRGDVNADEIINITDVVYLINYLFIGGPPPPPQ